MKVNEVMAIILELNTKSKELDDKLSWYKDVCRINPTNKEAKIIVQDTEISLNKIITTRNRYLNMEVVE